MAKKPKTLEELEATRWKKLRAAIRNVWQYDHDRKKVIEHATYIGTQSTKLPFDPVGKYFQCPICANEWPIDMATVDHEPELGGFSSWTEFFSWVLRCFTGPQRAVCKPCHRKKKRPSRKKGAK